MDAVMLWTLPIAGAAVTAGYYLNRYAKRRGFLVENDPYPEEEDAYSARYESPHPSPRTDEGRRDAVFLSYRRRGSWSVAQLVRNELEQRGFDVFVDVNNIDSGQFEPVILAQIEARRHFVLLLDLRSLEGVREPGDWLHREIAHALRWRRNVVPLLVNGATMPAAADLPPDIADLSKYNALEVPSGYISEAIERLHHRFLR